MCGWRAFWNLCKSSPKSDIIVLVTTFVLTVVLYAKSHILYLLLWIFLKSYQPPQKTSDRKFRIQAYALALPAAQCCQGPPPHFGNLNAVRGADSHALHRGNPVYGCLQYVRLAGKRMLWHFPQRNAVRVLLLIHIFPALHFRNLTHPLHEKHCRKQIAILAAIESLLSCVVADSMINKSDNQCLRIDCCNIVYYRLCLFCACTCVRGCSRTGYLYCNYCGLSDFIFWRIACADCRTNGGICNHCCRNCRTKGDGWVDSCNNSCRSDTYRNGILPQCL